MYKRSSGEVVESAREARGGYLDRPVLVVLAVSTVMAIVSLGLIWGLGT